MLSYEPIILTKETDFTGALKKVDVLEQVLKGNLTEDNYQNIIALYGGWGTGKSSVIRTLEKREGLEEYEILMFEAWHYERDNNLPLSLYEMLLNRALKFDQEISKEGKVFWSAVKGLARATNFSINLPIGSVNIDSDKIFSEIEKINEKLEMKSKFFEREEIKQSLNKVVGKLLEKQNKKKLLVFIDDLDRCENENLLNLITSIKQLFSLCTNVVFVVAIDKVAVTQALEGRYGDKSEKANQYLDKVFPVEFNLNHNFLIEKYFDAVSKKIFKENTYAKRLSAIMCKDYKRQDQVNPIPRNMVKLFHKLNEVVRLDSYVNMMKSGDEKVKEFSTALIYDLVFPSENRKNMYFIENMMNSLKKNGKIHDYGHPTKMEGSFDFAHSEINSEFRKEGFELELNSESSIIIDFLEDLISICL